MNTTTFKNPKEIERNWYILDAEGKTLGRFMTKVADVLRGKNKPTFSPNHDVGDFVIIINAEKIILTGKKWDQKKYYRHSKYPGGLKEEPASKLRVRKPEIIIQKAIQGMLPKNKLRDEFLKKLKVYAGSEHPHEAQKPINLEV